MKQFRKYSIVLVLLAVLLTVFTAVLSGCGGDGPPSLSSAEETGAMATYEQLAREKDIDGIRSLLKDLKQSEDYDSIGAILTKELDLPEGKRNSDPFSFDEVYDLLKDSPSSLALELWQCKYIGGLYDQPDSRFALLKKYNAIVRTEEITLSGALKKVTGTKWMYADNKYSFEELKKLCGKSKSGKVLIVQEGKAPSEKTVLSNLTGTNFSLMAAMDPTQIPSDYKDAQYIIRLQYLHKLSGRYTDGSDAKTIQLQCELIDCATGKTILEKTYEGTAPPNTKLSVESGTGSPPEDEKALDFIASALRRV